MRIKILVVSFDGILCENKWPDIGCPNEKLISFLHGIREAYAEVKMVLLTYRTGDLLREAMNWCSDHSLYFESIHNSPEEVLVWVDEDNGSVVKNLLVDYKDLTDTFGAAIIKQDDPSFSVPEFLGVLIDILEDWLDKKGITPDDIPNDEREDTDDAAIIYGSDYDYLADKFADVVGVDRRIVNYPRPKGHGFCITAQYTVVSYWVGETEILWPLILYKHSKSDVCTGLSAKKTVYILFRMNWIRKVDLEKK